MTKDEFLDLRAEGFTFKEIGGFFNLSERQVNYRTKAWGLDFSKKKVLDHTFFSRNTKETYYWAGFLAADGWVEEERNRVGLALQASDISHLEKFKSAVSSSHEICPFMQNTAYRIRFNSEDMVKDLRNRFNIVKSKTYNYQMPIFEEDYLMLEFLRGYIEGDGHLERTASGRVAVHLCSASESFLLEYKRIVESILYCNVPQEIYYATNKKGSVYTLRLNLDISRDLINLLYKNSSEATRLNRKYDVAKLVLR